MVPAENAAAALEVMSRFAVDPRWLLWLPPTMAPASTSTVEGYLEHPAEALAYYRAEGEAAWDMLDPQGLEEVQRIEEAVASMKAAKEAEHRATLLEIAREVGMALPEGLGSPDNASDEEPSPRT